MALPAGYEAQVRPRSGLAIKKGITVLNTPGTIDADYHEQPQLVEVEVLDETERGAGGFGHSGTK